MSIIPRRVLIVSYIGTLIYILSGILFLIFHDMKHKAIISVFMFYCISVVYYTFLMCFSSREQLSTLIRSIHSRSFTNQQYTIDIDNNQNLLTDSSV